MRHAGEVVSADGTTIAFDAVGSGPAVILVEAAGHYRGLTSFAALTDLLSEHFTIYNYDRRGRGASGNTLPYAVGREVDDLAALIDHVDGSASVYGFSSGALVALHAAARGLAMHRLAVLEPPIRDDGATDVSEFTRDLIRLVDGGRLSDAVEYFHTSIGVPAELVEEMRGTDAWAAMEAVAPTLVYDGVLGDESPASFLADVPVRTLVIDSEGSTDDLTGMAATVARALPQASHVSLPGEWHGPRDEDLASTLVTFFGGERA